MSLAELSVRHPVTTVMAFLALALSGILSLGRLGLELFPNISMPTVAIVTIYPGAGSFEVESGVSKPIEEAVAELNGVSSIASTSSEGVSMVTVRFNWGTDIEAAVADMREKLNAVSSRLPDGAQRPGIHKYDPTSLAFMTLSVSAADEGIDQRRLVEKELVPLIEKVPGVASVSVYGGRRAAVTVELDLGAISSFEVSIAQVLQAFQYDNVSLPAGSLTMEGRHVVLRTVGDFQSPADVGDLLVGYRGQSPVYLRDVAEVRLGSLPQEEFVRASGSRGVYLSLRKQPGFSTVLVARAVKAATTRARAAMPASIRIDVQTDQSVSVVESIQGVSDAAWQGGLLAILVLVVFLRNLVPTVIIATVIPLSVVSVFGPMSVFGYTLNITSLMGISLGVGMFVDNSIVVLETVYRKRLGGLGPREAAVEGTKEVGIAVSASTLTTVVVFVPLLFVQGFAGQIFKDLAFTISWSLMASLLVALTLIPVLCARFLKLPKGLTLDAAHASDPYYELSLADVSVATGIAPLDAVSAAIKRGLVRLDDFYERAIEWALDHATAVVGAALVLAALSAGSVLLVGAEFVPETDEGRFSIGVETRIGAPYEYTESKVALVEAMVRERVGTSLVAMTSSIGRSGGLTGFADAASNVAVIDVSMARKDLRRSSVWEVIRDLQAKGAAGLADARLTFQVDSISTLANSAQGDATPVVLRIKGKDIDAMLPYAERLLEVLRTVPGTRGADISYKAGKPELQFRVRRAEAASLGITPLEVGVALRTAFRGTEVTRLGSGGEDYPVWVLLRDRDRADWRSIRSLFFVNRAGAKVPLENVAEIAEGMGPFSIFREDRGRVMSVTAFLDGTRPLSRVMDDLSARTEALGAPPPGVELETAGTSKEMASSFRDLFGVLGLAIFLVYVVMASQFESLLHPFIILFSIPFAAIGMIGALLVTGTTFNLVAFVGAILLVGYVVNNGIVLVDYVNTLRRRGLPLRDSLIKGGRTRLKPILMSVGTTLLGLLPLALGLGTGSELRAPMGRAVFGGLASSTVVTLILIPTMYWTIEKRREGRAGGGT